MTALAEGFATPTREDWLKAVRAALKGEPFERLIHRTVEDLAIQPLYGPDGPPGRLRPRAPREGSAWDIRTRVAHPDPAEANAQILDDLTGGASSIVLAIGADPGRPGPQPSGRAVRAVERLDLQVFDGVADEAFERLALQRRANGLQPLLPRRGCETFGQGSHHGRPCDQTNAPDR